MTRQHNHTQMLPAVGVVNAMACRQLVSQHKRFMLCTKIVRRNMCRKQNPPDPDPSLKRCLPQGWMKAVWVKTRTAFFVFAPFILPS